MKTVMFLNVAILATTFCFADTLYVPSEYSTIQAGIDAASNGDTVQVAPGTYYENINFKGKTITVKSEWGPVHSVIDGGQADTVVLFENYESRLAVLDGFMITNGYLNIGGGINCYSHASPTLTADIDHSPLMYWIAMKIHSKCNTER